MVMAVQSALFCNICIIGIGQIRVLGQTVPPLVMHVPKMHECQSIIFLGGQQSEQPGLQQT